MTEHFYHNVWCFHLFPYLVFLREILQVWDEPAILSEIGGFMFRRGSAGSVGTKGNLLGCINAAAWKRTLNLQFDRVLAVRKYPSSSLGVTKTTRFLQSQPQLLCVHRTFVRPVTQSRCWIPQPRRLWNQPRVPQCYTCCPLCYKINHSLWWRRGIHAGRTYGDLSF